MMCLLNQGVLFMTAETIERRRQPHEKGLHYPFAETYMEILDKMIEESRKEMYKENAKTDTGE